MKRIKSQIIDIEKVYSEKEVVLLIKKAITVKMLRNRHSRGDGIPYVNEHWFPRYYIHDVINWIKNNFPQ